MGLPDASVWLCPACSLSMAAQCPWRLQLPRLRSAQCPCPGCACHPSLCSAAPSSQGASGTPSSAPRPNASLHPSLTSWGYLSPALLPPNWGIPARQGDGHFVPPHRVQPPPLGLTLCPECRGDMRRKRNGDTGAGRTPLGAGGETRLLAWEAGFSRLEKPRM